MTGEVHINRPSSTRYQAMVRGHGLRRWALVGKVHKSQRAAANAMLAAFMTRDVKRGCVLVIADYYDPLVVMEIVRP